MSRAMKCCVLEAVPISCHRRNLHAWLYEHTVDMRCMSVLEEGLRCDEAEIEIHESTAV